MAAASGWFGRIGEVTVVGSSSEELVELLSDSTGEITYYGAAPWTGDELLLVTAPPPYCLPMGLEPTVPVGSEVLMTLDGYRNLRSPAAALMAPGMTITDLTVDSAGVTGFRAQTRGVYWVEVLREGERGPAVELLFPVIAGGTTAEAVAGELPGYETDAGSAGDILAEMNELRLRAGVEPLRSSAFLDSLARMRAVALALSGGEDHLPARGASLGEMLPARAGGYAENIGRGAGFREAWSIILISPFHLRTCLSPELVYAGMGSALDSEPFMWQLVVVQVFTGEDATP